MKTTCRHNRTWLTCGGCMEWCYECGAIRKMVIEKMIANAVKPFGRWIKPVGKGGQNPAIRESK